MFRVDVTWLGYFMALVSIYYVALFVAVDAEGSASRPRQ